MQASATHIDIMRFEVLGLATTVNVGVLAGLLVIFALIGTRSDTLKKMSPSKAATTEAWEQFRLEVSILLSLILISSTAIVLSAVSHYLNFYWVMATSLLLTFGTVLGIPVYVFVAKRWLVNSEDE